SNQRRCVRSAPHKRGILVITKSNKAESAKFNVTICSGFHIHYRQSLRAPNGGIDAAETVTVQL
ncbi:MAG: hypothetical protein ACRD4L_05195, partial [Pyrinomonadaceae bacterium]